MERQRAAGSSRARDALVQQGPGPSHGGQRNTSFKRKEVFWLLGGSAACLTPSPPSRPVQLLGLKTLLGGAYAASLAGRRRAQGEGWCTAAWSSCRSSPDTLALSNNKISEMKNTFSELRLLKTFSRSLLPLSFLKHCPQIWFWGKITHWLECANSSRFIWFESPRGPPVSASRHWIYFKCATWLDIFLWGRGGIPGVQLLSKCLKGKHFIDWALFPAAVLLFSSTVPRLSLHENSKGRECSRARLLLCGCLLCARDSGKIYECI